MALDDEAVPAPKPAPDRRPRRAIAGILAVLVIAAIGAWIARTRRPAVAHGGPNAPASGSAGGRIVPVSVAKVVQKDVPVYLDGIGNVTAYMTVNVRSQVEGRIDKVLFKEGQQVKAGDVLVQVDPRPFAIQLHSAQAALARDQANLANAKKNLDRYKTLRDQNLIPQQQVDDQQAMVDQLAATTMSDRATIESAQLNLDYARIKSPIEGVTGVRLVDPGNLVHVNDTNGIVVVTQLDPIAVLFTLPEDDLPRVAKRLAEGAAPVDAFARDGTTKLGSGTLALVDNQINAQTATIRLKAIFPNPQRSLWPNQFVKARLYLETRKNALVVPATALQRGPQGTFVYVVGEGDHVEPRTIDIDAMLGDSVIVAKGLEPGEDVVTEGQTQLRPGAKVVRKGNGRPGAPAGSASAMPAKTFPAEAGSAPPGAGRPHARPHGSGP